MICTVTGSFELVVMDLSQFSALGDSPPKFYFATSGETIADVMILYGHEIAPPEAEWRERRWFPSAR